MTDENITYYAKAQAEESKYSGIIKDWRLKVRELLVPLCETCARLDYRNGEFVEDWKHYTSLSKNKFKKVKDEQVESRNKVSGEPMEFSETWECEDGHKVSVFYSLYEKKLKDKNERKNQD